jgi:hypothetical protein
MTFVSSPPTLEYQRLINKIKYIVYIIMSRLYIREIFKGLTNLLKALNCRLTCCCESSCSQQEEIEEYEGPEYDPIKKRWLGVGGLDGDKED